MASMLTVSGLNLALVPSTARAFGAPRPTTSQTANQAAKPATAKAAPRKIFIAVDGMSFDAFREAQRQGLFAAFKNVGHHVAPFPTMTDMSWSIMTHSAEHFGAAGRIKNVEATYFDESSQSIQGDPRDYYQRLAFPKYYLGAFDVVFNPYVEALVYFPTEEVPKMEIKSVIDDLLAAKPKPVLTAYVGSVDSTAHTQLNRLFPVMRVLDSELKRLQAGFRERGEEVEIILMSDHGNIGRFKEGGPEQELVGIEISKTIERAGLKFVQQLKDTKDVAMPLLALGTWGPVYFKDRKNRAGFVNELKKESWFDLAIAMNKNNAKETLMSVASSTGEARLRYDKEKDLYFYTPVAGNPLQIPAAFHSSAAVSRPISPDQVQALSEGTPYPDAIYRLIESASERNFDFPDLIVTLKDGFFIQNALGGFTKMYRTHGSLTAASSAGVLATTTTAIPAAMRTKDLFGHFGVNTRDLFGEELRLHEASGRAALDEVWKNAQRGVETKARDLSQPRIFRHMSRFISDTRPYFLVSEITDFMKAFKTDPLKDPSGMGLTPMNFDMSKFDIPSMISNDDIGAITDAVLTGGSVEGVLQDPRVEKVKERISFLRDVKTANLKSAAEGGGQDGLLGSISSYFLPSKRSVMKMYQIPYLLQNSLVLQEKQFLPEVRDLRFAANWTRGGREAQIKSFKAMNAKSENVQGANSQKPEEVTVAQKLFQEIRKEIDLEHRVYPTPMAKIYNTKPDDITVVYVPGIYNSIFDKEIFSLGLSALRDDYGLRVLQPPVESTCNSDVNGSIILNYLYQDLSDRVQRGHKAPRYLFISYSKGAVDTLDFFTKYPGFVSTYVMGMASVAAPLHGSSILNKSSLPFSVVSALSEGQAPEICKTEKSAEKSISPAAMDSFWRKNERMLTGLTRYFSLTFESSPEDSHVFMKATKMIAQFDEDNDGVVTVSSSKFPPRLQALDLGTVHADHLAGILSSNFNQKVFMKAIVQTMAELDIKNTNQNFAWNSKAIIDVASAGRSWWQGNAKPDIPYSNSWDLNRLMLPPVNDPASSYETQTKLPSSQLRYDPYNIIDIQKMPDVLAATPVSPATRQNMPNGIVMDYHHKNMVHFRMDHQFNYESRSPLGLDDNKEFGFVGAEFNGEPNWLFMRSVNNSIRMTTMAYRFSPADFPNVDLKLAVTKDVVGADSIKGKTGKDDSPFQVWFTIRDGKANGDRTLVDAKNDKVILFGYYWGSPVPGEVRPAGTIYENWYSNKNVVIVTLPEAKQLLLNNPDMLGKAQDYKRNLVEDLRRAFPNRRVEDMEIVAITLQHDSNDTGTSSEAYFKSLSFTP